MRTLSTLLFCFLISSSPASATLIDMGDVTRDTDQQLDWLDVTASLNLSFSQIEAGAGGFVAAGYRYASKAEVCGLFLGLGMTPPCPDPTPDSPTFVYDATLAEEITLLLGDTSGGSFARVDGIFDDGFSGDGQVGLAQMLEFSAGAQFFVRDDHRGSSQRSSLVGSFLVRPIPEPSTAFLLGFGMAALSLARRCGAARPSN